MKRFYLSRLVIPIALLSGLNQTALAQLSTYSTAGAYVYTVPAGCTAVQCNVCGAQAGAAWATAGKGGCVQAAVAVTAGQLLYVYVGGQGVAYPTCTGGSSSGGEAGGNGGTSDGGSGGGAGSDIRNSITGGAATLASLNTRVLIGGGGGGDSYDCGYNSGGSGGYPTGVGGGGSCGCTNTTGGTQTTGGSPQSCGTSAGGFGPGGGGNYYGGGGGGGWYGGGGGYEGSGSGGSSSAQTVGINVPTGVTYSNGTQTGAGLVTILPLVPSVTPTPASLTFAPALVGSPAVADLYTTLAGVYMTNTTLTLSIAGGSCASCFSLETDVTATTTGWVAGGTGATTNMTIANPTFSGGQVYVSCTPNTLGAVNSFLLVSGGGLTTPVSVPLNGSGVVSCSGTPSTPLCVATPSTGGIYSNFTLSLTPAFTSGGYSYQWQSSTTGSAPWTNIGGAVLSTYSFTGLSATTFYQCLITCNASGLTTTATPTVITYAGLAANGCSTPTTTNAYCCGFSIGQPAPYAYVVSGTGSSSMTDNFVISGTAVYHDFTASLNITEAPGSSPTAQFAGNTSVQTSSMNIQMWVDFNNDGIFQASETIGGGSSSVGARTTVTLNIPATAQPGVYRFRTVLDYATGNPAYPSIPPCPPTGSALTYGDIRDYTMIIGPGACSGAQEAGIAQATSASACQPSTFMPTILNIGESNASGVTYTWQTSATGIPGSWTNIGGATSTSYTPSITTAGVTYFRNSVGCAGTYTYSAPVSVSLNPAPTPITPTPANICTGVPSTLVSTPVGGTWTSSNTAVATTAGSLSGAVTGITVGVVNITYTLPTGCYASAQVTVNTQPPAFTSMPPMCVGQTLTVSDAFTGGTWTSSTPTVASIGGVTGLITAVAPGTTNITYASVFGCTTSAVLTVNALPGLFIVSPASYSYCAGSASSGHITLSGSTAGVTYQLLLSGSSTGLPSLAGTGLSLDFGVQSAPGTYTVVATNNSTGCSRAMVGSGVFSINPVPTVFNVSGGGSYCSGSLASAPHIFLSGSQPGVNYRLQVSGATILTLAGSGAPLDFGTATLAGCYTVVAQNASTGCTSNMSGSACVTINSLPTAYNVLPPGGGSFCIGGSGVDVQLSFSNTGITYKLWNGATLAGMMSGTGGLLDFGNITVPGTYTVTGQNVITTCMASMAGAATIAVNPLPNQYTVQTATGGSSGSFCAGGAGVDIQLSATDGGVNYQLYLGTAMVGTALGGTGLSIDFGYYTAAGTYTVVAQNSTTLCSNNMLGSVTVMVNPLPPLCTVTGGGNFCIGGPGVHIGLNPSTIGISYQLMNGLVPVGSVVMGTGSALDFGIFSAVGIYTVVATNTVTGCSVNMTGVATISTNPLPAPFNVTGGGSYCSGGSGTPVGLDFSATGITYQLYRGGMMVGTPVSGTGTPITFGIETVSGTYTVTGTNVSTACTGNMSGSAVISINVVPNLHLVTGGGNFCAGDSGRHVGLNGSEPGISYQLYLGTAPVGTALAGTGSLLDFGLQTTGGTYIVQATNTVTGCTRYMSGGIPINVYALPGAYLVTGGGLYCAGAPGVHVGLSGSVAGITYQLFNGGPTGTALPGTGMAIDFGIQVAAGSYTVVGINSATGCTSNMSGSVNVGTNPLPTVYTVTGGGNYCAGGSGSTISLSGSDVSVNYQLMDGTTVSGTAMPGTGSGLSFGPLTATGIYTVVAVNSVTGCMNPMAGSATIGINALPTPFGVAGGGNFCAGGAGEHIFLAGSLPGVTYQLYNDTSMVGTAMAGTGGGLDFGAQPGAGIYTVVATNTTTTCMNNMPGSATISIYPLPATHNVTGGGSYCTGGTGANIGLDGSNFGVLYQLYQGGVATGGVAVPGTGSNLNFGLHTAAGTYTIVAVNNSTSCTSNMSGSATVSISPLPVQYNVTGGGNYCATGTGVHVYLSGSNAGTNYTLWNGTTMVGTAVGGTGGTIDFGLEALSGAYSVTAVNPTTTCTNNMVGSVTVAVLPVLLPSANIVSSLPTGLACVGQSVTYTATPVNGGTAPTYQWLVNGASVGVTSTTFSYIPVDGDKVTAMITSNYQCAIPDTGSGSMVMTVSPPEMPSVSVSVNPGTQICTGGTATFTASTSYGGPSPVTLWIKNSTFVGTGTTYSYVPANGDIVTFMLGSDFACRLSDTVFSPNTMLVVSDPVLPVVTIAANPGTNITAGESVTFTASVTHGGVTPVYQWVVNSTEVPGATNSSWTASALNNHDSVSCMVNGTCGLVGFNSVGITVSGHGVGFTNVTGNASNVTLVPNPNKGGFTVKGSLSSNIDQEVTLEVVDMIGQVVYSNKVMATGGNINQHVQLNNIANGMYLMNMRTGSESVVFHFVIEQ